MQRAEKGTAPQVFGRYALYDEIAAGGMATVHLGRMIGSVGFARTVAIKRLHPHFAKDPEFVSMFLDEARLVARISHPNVVPTLDVVATEGELFIVMEYVRGESLARLIRGSSSDGKGIPPAIAATLMVGVLHGLHAAHEAKTERGEPLGIVHRDVSPHNILVGTDGVARVLDFGVAKAAGRIQTTREGQLKGKLAYMAPEQTGGSVGRTTDVYAASVVLWEALTGRRLFAGNNEGEVLRRVLEARIVPPSRHASGIPRALDKLTLQGLSFDPARRFPTARDMARALEDAVPLVAASKIGEWVESISAKTLDERRHRISRIEGDPSMQPMLTAPGSDAPLVSRVAASPPRDTLPAKDELTGMPFENATQAAGVSSLAVTDDMIMTQLSSGSVSSPGRLVQAARSGRLWLAVSVSGATILAVAVLAVALARHGTAENATAAMSPSALVPPAEAPATAAAAPSGSTMPAAADPVAPSASNAPTASVDVPRAAAPVPTSRPASTPALSPTKAAATSQPAHDVATRVPAAATAPVSSSQALQRALDSRH